MHVALGNTATLGQLMSVHASAEDCSARTRQLLATATASGISHAQLAAATLQLSKKTSTVAEDLTPEEKRDKLLVSTCERWCLSAEVA